MKTYIGTRVCGHATVLVWDSAREYLPRLLIPRADLTDQPLQPFGWGAQEKGGMLLATSLLADLLTNDEEARKYAAVLHASMVQNTNTDLWCYSAETLLRGLANVMRLHFQSHVYPPGLTVETSGGEPAPAGPGRTSAPISPEPRKEADRE